MGLTSRRGTIVYEDSDDSDDETSRLLRSVPPGRSTSIGGESILLEEPAVYKSRWRSIRVMYLTMFLSSVSFSICMSSLYPYLKVLDKSATTDFLGWVVAAYSLGQLFAAPLFGTWANVRKNSREPIIVSLTINILANVLYMYLESINKHATVYLVIARAFIGFGAGNAAVVRSYTAGATTLKERTPAMANMSACQAVGFIIGPVIQAALVPVGYPGLVHSPGLHLDLYTAPGLLGVVMGILNVVLIIVVFREHTITDKQYITSIQETAEDVDDDKSQSVDDSPPLDYVAVVSLIMLFFVVLFIFSIFETIATPISMHMFAWTKSQATLYVGLILGCAGVVSIVDFFFVKILSKKFNERKLMLGGFIVCLFGFIAYLPWGHNYPAIQYAVITDSSFTNSTNTSWSESPYLEEPYQNPSLSHRRLLSIINNREDSIMSLSSNGSTTSTIATSTSRTPTSTTPTHSTPTHSTPTHSTPTHSTPINTTIHTSHHTSHHSSSKLTTSTTEQTITTDVISTESESTVNPETTHSAPETTHSVPETTHSATFSTHRTTHRQHTTESTTHIPSTVETTKTITTSTHSTVEPTTHGQHTTEITSESHSTHIPTIGTHSTEFTTHSSSVETTTSSTHNTTAEATGCPYTYSWCFDTPAIVLWQFILATLLVSIGYPTCSVMSYTMYSKILGPKPQGVWMGWMTAAGSLSRTVGPIFVSQVYDAYGPRVTMVAIDVVIVLTIVGLLVVYKRLVPYKMNKVVKVTSSNGHVK